MTLATDRALLLLATSQERAGNENLLPGGLDGHRDAVDRAGEGDEPRARGAHVPAEGEGTAPLRRYEGQVVGQGVEDDRNDLVEHLPGDRVVSAGAEGVEPGPSEFRRPRIGELVELAVLESQILVDIDGPFAVEGDDAQGAPLIRERGAGRDLDEALAAGPAEEKLRAVDGE